MAQAVLARVPARLQAPAALPPRSPPPNLCIGAGMDFSSIPGVAERYVTANKGRVPVLFAKRDTSGDWSLAAAGGANGAAEAAPSLAKRTSEMMKRDLLGADATLSGRIQPDLLDTLQGKGKRVLYMGK
uniref:Uncharacterized protein n=1 Tax=Alexandrium monilatum TaxID=311494 RepID=A0A7S4W1M4_9DINO